MPCTIDCVTNSRSGIGTSPFPRSVCKTLPAALGFLSPLRATKRDAPIAANEHVFQRRHRRLVTGRGNRHVAELLDDRDRFVPVDGDAARNDLVQRERRVVTSDAIFPRELVQLINSHGRYCGGA